MRVLKNNIIKCFITPGQSSFILELRQLLFHPFVSLMETLTLLLNLSFTCLSSYKTITSSSSGTALLLFLKNFFFGCYLFRIKNGTYPQFKNHTRIQKEIKKHLPQISLMRSSYFWHQMHIFLNISMCSCRYKDRKNEQK